MTRALSSRGRKRRFDLAGCSGRAHRTPYERTESSRATFTSHPPRLCSGAEQPGVPPAVRYPREPCRAIQRRTVGLSYCGPFALPDGLAYAIPGFSPHLPNSGLQPTGHQPTLARAQSDLGAPSLVLTGDHPVSHAFVSRDVVFVRGPVVRRL